ncbi:MAG: DUF134 domain-containing protein [Candidatus Kariarchaeaceae archaeon]
MAEDCPHCENRRRLGRGRGRGRGRPCIDAKISSELLKREEEIGVLLSPVHLEAIYQVDVLNNSQTEAAKIMNISQSTLSRILGVARHKVGEGIVSAKKILVEIDNS